MGLVAARRQVRMRALGFVDLGAYLADRYVGRGWSLRRVRAELRVSAAWLRAELVRRGIHRTGHC
jgi:hypothetical protein